MTLLLNNRYCLSCSIDYLLDNNGIQNSLRSPFFQNQSKFVFDEFLPTLKELR